MSLNTISVHGAFASWLNACIFASLRLSDYSTRHVFRGSCGPPIWPAFIGSLFWPFLRSVFISHAPAEQRARTPQKMSEGGNDCPQTVNQWSRPAIGQFGVRRVRASRLHGAGVRVAFLLNPLSVANQNAPIKVLPFRGSYALTSRV